MIEFGERLRELRKAQGITGYELASKLGISRNTLSSWERGDKEPRAIEVLEEMAKILKVSLRILIEGKREERIENNPVIKNLNERVTRLETILRKR